MDAKLLLEVLDKASLSLAGLEFSPINDEQGEIVGAQLVITADLVDLQDEYKSAVQIIEDNMLDENESLSDVLKTSESEFDAKEEEE